MVWFQSFGIRLALLKGVAIYFLAFLVISAVDSSATSSILLEQQPTYSRAIQGRPNIKCFTDLLKFNEAQKQDGQYMASVSRLKDRLRELKKLEKELVPLLNSAAKEHPEKFQGERARKLTAIRETTLDTNAELKRRIQLVAGLWVGIKKDADLSFIPDEIRRLETNGRTPTYRQIYHELYALKLRKDSRHWKDGARDDISIQEILENVSANWEKIYEPFGNFIPLKSLVSKVDEGDWKHLYGNSSKNKTLKQYLYSDAVLDETNDRFLVGSLGRILHDSSQLSALHPKAINYYAHLAQLIFHTYEMKDASPAMWLDQTVTTPLETQIKEYREAIDGLRNGNLDVKLPDPRLNSNMFDVPRHSEVGSTVHAEGFTLESIQQN